MARSTDLMGLGLPHLLAQRIGDDPIAVTAAGAAIGSATTLGGAQSTIFVNASNSGSGIKLPQIGGDNGCLLGDEFNITNLLSATIAIYASTNNAGSAMQIFANSTSATGSTGMSLISGAVGIFRAITVSTWIGIKSSV